MNAVINIESHRNTGSQHGTVQNSSNNLRQDSSSNIAVAVVAAAAAAVGAATGATTIISERMHTAATAAAACSVYTATITMKDSMSIRRDTANCSTVEQAALPIMQSSRNYD